MHIEKINISQQTSSSQKIRPDSFDNFIGQSHIVRIIKTAIDSAHKQHHQL